MKCENCQERKATSIIKVGNPQKSIQLQICSHCCNAYFGTKINKENDRNTMTKCTHPFDHESIKQCALKFQGCWNVQNKPAKDKRISNKPHGTGARDINFNQSF